MMNWRLTLAERWQQGRYVREKMTGTRFPIHDETAVAVDVPAVAAAAAGDELGRACAVLLPALQSRILSIFWPIGGDRL